MSYNKIKKEIRSFWKTELGGNKKQENNISEIRF